MEYWSLGSPGNLAASFSEKRINITTATGLSALRAFAELERFQGEGNGGVLGMGGVIWR